MLERVLVCFYKFQRWLYVVFTDIMYCKVREEKKNFVFAVRIYYCRKTCTFEAWIKVCSLCQQHFEKYMDSAWS